ncbi:hypothetical protein HYS54_01970 [Candidatus Micrarchaeota archaeon]|nr:hypothetical protein [Candidatus Micrarchaeota archaeon]
MVPRVAPAPVAAPAAGGGSGLGFFALDRSGLGIMTLATLGIYFLGWLIGNIGVVAGSKIAADIGILILRLGAIGLSAGFIIYGLQPREDGVARIGFLVAGALVLTGGAR